MVDEEKSVSEKETEKDDIKDLDQDYNYDKDYYRHYSHHSPMRMIFGILIGLVVLGGAFALGHASNRFERGNSNQVIFERSVGSRMMSGRGMMGQGFRRSATSASVTTVDGNNITITKNSKDYSVIVNDQTSYIKTGEIAKQSDLKVGDNVEVTGTSNSQGVIIATQIIIQ